MDRPSPNKKRGRADICASRLPTRPLPFLEVFASLHGLTCSCAHLPTFIPVRFLLQKDGLGARQTLDQHSCLVVHGQALLRQHHPAYLPPPYEAEILRPFVHGYPLFDLLGFLCWSPTPQKDQKSTCWPSKAKFMRPAAEENTPLT